MLASKYASKVIKAGGEIETELDLSDVNEEVIGNMLFDIAVIAKKNKIDPELAMQKKCERFLGEVE